MCDDKYYIDFVAYSYPYFVGNLVLLQRRKNFEFDLMASCLLEHSVLIGAGPHVLTDIIIIIIIHVYFRP